MRPHGRKRAPAVRGRPHQRAAQRRSISLQSFRQTDQTSLGFTLVELMLGVAIVGTLAAVGVPTVTRARVSANESVAQAALTTYRSAMEIYYTVNGRYPDSLNLLGAVNGQLAYVDERLADGQRQGYGFLLSNASAAGFTITASPTVPQQTGNRIFILDQAGAIYESQLTRTTSTPSLVASGTPAQRARTRVDQLAAALERHKDRHGEYPTSLNDVQESNWTGDPEDLRKMKRAKGSNTALDEYAYFYNRDKKNKRRYSLQAHPQLHRGDHGYEFAQGARTVYTRTERGRVVERDVQPPRQRTR